jgi:ubiquinone/menaquinone biosynthesis C-methylase UbiE
MEQDHYHGALVWTGVECAQELGPVSSFEHDAMTGRGQDEFVRFPGFAARLYANLTRGRAIQQQHREIASELASRIERGRVLDVGTGPGYLLIELHRLNPSLELFGLDISRAMVDLARKNLSGLGVDVRLGAIQNAPYDGNFFDLVTCTGSFYLWDEPRAGLNEIFRILKRGRSAFLFETYRDCDRPSVRKAVRNNLRDESLVRRVIAPRLFLKQLLMTYDRSEVAAIVQQTRFTGSHVIERIALAGVPAWLRITLTKAT